MKTGLIRRNPQASVDSAPAPGRLPGAARAAGPAQFVLGPIGDAAEREADRASGRSGGQPFQSGLPASAGAQALSRGAAVSPQDSSLLRAARGMGRPLDPPVRRKMERRFQRDLRHVTIHTGLRSQRLNDNFSSHAFNVGDEIFFGEGAYNPDTTRGEEILAHEIAHAMQPGGPAVVRRWPKVITVLGQSVKVKDAREAKRARTMASQLKYRGVKLDSDMGVTAVRNAYPAASAAVRSQVKKRIMTYTMLNAVYGAVMHFDPIIGRRRAKSSRSAAPQEVTSIGMLEHSLDDDGTGTIAADPDTLGEYFANERNFSMFASSETTTQAFATPAAEALGTGTHEMAHGFLEYRIPAFVAAMPYWQDRNTPSGAVGAEEPPTAYGKTNADEDLSETAMLYFNDPTRLQRDCPQRYAFMQATVNAW